MSKRLLEEYKETLSSPISIVTDLSRLHLEILISESKVYGLSI